MKAGTGDEEPDGPSRQPLRDQPGHARPRPRTASKTKPCDHDGHPDDDGETSLDAYIARLVDAAPPLSSQQRDTLALLLRRPRRR